jgi:Ca-activated chloride channel family protein
LANAVCLAYVGAHGDVSSEGWIVDLDLQLFHFMRPTWLWGLPVFLLVWLLIKSLGSSSQWEQYIPKEMVSALQINATKQSNWWRWILLLSWTLLLIGAAGPTWQKQAAPVMENQNATVLVLDLSPSMLAQDLSPDRLTRAKYKLIDIIRHQADGQLALVAYAGDAHTVSPLTSDPKSIETLLPALHPNIMPIAGSNTEAAIALAVRLLKDAGAAYGNIILISDGVAEQAMDNIRDTVGSNRRLSILGVGSEKAAPIPMREGGFLRGADGEIILSSLDGEQLSDLATSLNGAYSRLSTDESDYKRLVSDSFENNLVGDNQSLDQGLGQSYNAWTDMGHLLALLTLPLFILLFRKGLVYVLPLMFLMPFQADAADSSWQDLSWANLLKTKDQQGAELLAQGKSAQAAKTFDNTQWQSIANYRNENYEAVIKGLSDSEKTEDLYNKANALALKGDLKQSLKTYDRVLEKSPDHEDAVFNKELIEELLQQQDQDQQAPPEESSQGQDGDSQDQGDQQQDSDSKPGQENSEDQSSDQQQDDSDSGQEQGEGEPEGSEQKPEQDQNDGESQEEQQQPGQQSEDESDTEQQDEPTNPQAEDSDPQDQGSEQNSGALDEDPAPLDDSSEQWLRGIPDDPGGLLRRKFKYQAEQRALQKRSGKSSNDDAQEPRY